MPKKTNNSRFFSGVISSGPGIKRSTMTIVGDVDPSSALGQAGIRTTFDAGYGNLFLQDHTTHIEALGFHFNLGMVYNNQTDQVIPFACWQFNIVKQLTAFSPTVSVALAEPDDSSTTFSYDSKTNQYIATGIAEGHSFLKQNSDSQWTLYCPGTGETSIFINGYESTRTDRLGRSCDFTYDNQNRLTKISFEVGHFITFTYSNNTIVVAYQEGQNPTQLLKTYTLDPQGRLTQTTIPVSSTTNYEINYQYDSTNGYLKSVQQTDGTSLSFSYNKEAVASIAVGNNPAYTMTYDETNCVTTLTDPRGEKTEFHYYVDENACLCLDRIAHPLTASTQEVVDFKYTPEGLLQKKTYSSGVLEAREYDTLGLLQSSTDALGHVHRIFRDSTTGLIFSRVAYPQDDQKSDPLTHRYVYNAQQQLIGEITPKGSVSVYTYDQNGNRVSSRQFLAAFFDAGSYQPNQPVPLENLQTWCGQQNVTQTRLISFGYNDRGQCTNEIHYVTLDANGNGVLDDKARVITREWDAWGDCLTKTERQSDSASSTDSYEFDEMQRLTLHKNPINDQTSAVYQDEKKSVITTRPNGLVTTIVKDSTGLPSEQQDVAENITRTTTYSRNALSEIYQAEQPDGQPAYQIHDEQNRLCYQVDSAGHVTEHQYDDQDHQTDEIQYAKEIEIKGIDWSTMTPDNFATHIIVDEQDDRHLSYLYDTGNRLRFTVDGEDQVIEEKYDDTNRRIARVRYATHLDSTVPRTFKAVQNAVISMPTTGNRIHHFYLDDDGFLQGEQDADGYVTEYIRNTMGEITETICYATPTASADTLAAARPAVTPNDAHHWYSRDLQGQVAYEVDAESYLTGYVRLSNGLVSQEMHYATPIDMTKVHSITDIHPIDDPEDQITTHGYDLLNRETSRHEMPIDRMTTTQYDSDNHVIEQTTQDGKSPENKRTTATTYNPFGAKSTDVNPRQGTTTYTYDNSGLCLTVTDPLNNKTINYYNAQRQLLVAVDPRGAVTEYTYDAFDKVCTTGYAAFVPSATLPTLTGGFINETVTSLLESLADPTKDKTTTQKFDRCGRSTSTIDAEQYQVIHVYDAFGDVITQQQQVTQAAQHNNMQWLITQNTFNGRSLPTTIIVDDTGLKVTTETTYNLHRQPASVTNPDGHETTYTYDRRGLLHTTTDALGNLSSQTCDAFHRVVTQTDRLNQTTTTVYDSAQRKHTTTSPEGRELITVATAFSQTQSLTDSNGSTTSFNYDPAGAQIQQTDALGRVTQDEYNEAGWHDTHTAPNQTITRYSHDVSGFVTGHVEAPAAQKITVAITPDHLGLEAIRVNPIQTTENTARDRRGLAKTKTIKNSNGPDIVSGFMNDGLGNLIVQTQGDSETPIQRTVTYTHDTAGRSTGHVTDPDGLALTVQEKRNQLGALIATVDPKGQTTRFILDELRRKRFTVTANGAVTQYNYDAEGRTLLQRQYITAINTSTLNNNTTPADVLALVTENAQDRLTLYRYDHDGKCIYAVNALGNVTQYLYDTAGRRIGQTNFANPINIAAIHTTNPSEITQLLTPDPTHDRTEYHLLDLAGQEVFAIDALGVVTQYVYDSNDNRIQTTQYANPIDLSSLPSVTPAAVQAALNPSADDRTTDHVYDDIDRLIYIIDAESYVTENGYDNYQQVTRQIAYVLPLNAIPSPLTVESVAAAIQHDDEHDRKTMHQYDVIRNKTLTTHSLGETEKWTYNPMSECVNHTDRGNFEWDTQYDNAGRVLATSSPETTIAQVTNDPTHAGRLIYNGEAHARLMEILTPDANGNTVSHSRGYWVSGGVTSTLVTTLEFTYDELNHITKTSMPNVPVDNPATTLQKPGDRPDVAQTVTTSRVLNVLGQPLVEVDEAGQGQFNLYDAAGRILYHVKYDGSVTKFTRNAFSEVTQATQFATLLTESLQPFLTTGLTVEWLEENLQPSAQDRTVTTTYDRAGHTLSTKLPPVWSYTQDDFNTIHIDQVQPTTYSSYNAFGDKTTATVLLDVQGTTAITHEWVDRRGKLIAKVDAEGYVTLYRNNHDGLEDRRVEYATPVSTDLSNVNYHTLLTLITSNPEKDRSFLTEYDPLGRRMKVTQSQVVVQTVTLDSGTPIMSDEPAQDLTTTYTYATNNQIASITYPNGAEATNSYDELGRLIQQTSVPRDETETQSEIKAYEETKAINTTVRYREQYQFQFDALGKPTYQKRTVVMEAPSYHVLVADDVPADQITLQLFDVRGFSLKKQKPELSIEETSYTQTRQIARRFEWVTGWDESLQPIQRLYQTQTTFDVLDRPIVETERQVMTSDPLVWKKQYNAFGEVTTEGEGTGDDPWPVMRIYDAAGRLWLTTEDQGIASIHLFDANGKQTAQLRSPTDDLTTVKESDLPSVLTWGRERIQRVGIKRDRLSRVTDQYLPAFRYLPPGMPEPLITCLSIGDQYPGVFGSGAYSISWPAPKEKFWIARIFLDRTNGAQLPIVLEAKRVTTPDDIERFGVDVSSLVSDVYQYTLNYYMVDPQRGVNYNPREGTKGTLVLDTGITDGALHLAVKLADESTLVLTGKTADVLGIALYPAAPTRARSHAHVELLEEKIQFEEKEEKVSDPIPAAKLGVTTAPIPGRYTIDLDDQMTGSYTAKPITIAQAQGNPLTLNQTDPQGRRVEFHNTTITRDDIQNYEQVSWHDAPPGCYYLQGEFNYANYTGGGPSSRTYTLASQPLSTGFLTPESEGHFNYHPPANFLPVTNILYGTDNSGSPATRRVIGEAHNKYIPETEIPSYLYFNPAAGEQTNLIAVLDAQHNVIGYVGLTDWLGGWQRAVFDPSIFGEPTAYTYQALSLGSPDLSLDPIDAFNITTKHQPVGLNAQIISMPDFAVVFSETNPTRFEWHLPKNLSRQPFQINYTLLNGMERSTWVGHDFLDKAGFYPGGAIPTKVVADWLFYDGQTIEALRAGEVPRRTEGHAYYTIRSLLLHPIPTGSKTATLQYFQEGNQDENIGWITIGSSDYKIQNTTMLVAQLNGLDAGAYAFRIKFFDENNHQLQPNPIPAPLKQTTDGWTIGTFLLVDHPGDQVTPSIDAQYVWAESDRKQTFDRWGNALNVTDPLGNTTVCTYNSADRMIQQTDPPVEVVDEYGVTTNNYQPVTTYGYDTMHRPIGVKKPKGGVTAYFKNLAGNITNTVRPNKVSEQTIWDGFGRKQKSIDPNGGTTAFAYDDQDRLTSETDPYSWKTTHGYNERDQRTQTSNPNSETMHFDYDERDRVVMTQFPEGNRVTRTFDRNGESLTEDDGASHPLLWERDPFGNVKTHTDKATDSTGAPGAQIEYQRDSTNQLTAIITQRAGNHGKQYLWGNPSDSEPVPPMQQKFIRDEAGHLRWLIDEQQEWRTRYLYDLIGRRGGERFIGNDDQVYQDTYLTINPLGWVTHLEDLRLDADYSFDPNGNRRHTQAWYKQLSADMNPKKTISHPIDSANQWFDYDADDLMIVDRGILPNGGKVTIGNGQGTQLIYDIRGWRYQEVSLDVNGITETKTITYLSNGLVSTTTTAPKGTVRTYAYDRASRRTTYQEQHPDGSATKEDTSPYDHNGRLTQQAQYTKAPGKDWVTSSTTTFTQFDTEGHPHHQETIYSPGQNQITDELDSEYVGFDALQVVQNQGTRTQNGKTTAHGTIYVTYDSNGNFQSVTGDLTHPGDFRWFRTNPENRIIFKQSDKRWEYYVYGPDGGVLAWVGDLPSDPTSADTPTEVNFDPWYHAVSPQWPLSCPSQYTVQDGDTFSGIAHQLYGSANFAYLISQANGYSQGDTPPEGMVLTIPSRTWVSQNNNAGQFAPYNPGQIVGVLYPYMPVPPRRSHVNLLGMALEIFVGALVSALLTPVVTGALEGTLGEVLATMVGLSTSAIAADTAEQGVALLTGMETSFSLTETLTQGELSLVTAGLASVLSRIPKMEFLMKFVEKNQRLTFSESLMGNDLLTIGGDLVLLATGQRKQFTWRDLLNSTASALINADTKQMVRSSSGLSRAAESWLSDLLNSEVGGYLTALIYRDHFNPWVAASQAFGTWAADEATYKPEEEQQKQAEKKEFAKTIAAGTTRAFEEQLRYFDEGPNDWAAGLFANETSPTGSNPDPLKQQPMGASTRPMSRSTSTSSNTNPHSPTRSDPRFFGRNALSGSQSAISAPQQLKQTRNDNICRINWSQVQQQDASDSQTSQQQTSGFSHFGTIQETEIHGAADAIRGFLAHPIDSLIEMDKGFGYAVEHPVQWVKGVAEQFRVFQQENDIQQAYSVGQFTGNVLVGGLIPGGVVVKEIADIARYSRISSRFFAEGSTGVEGISDLRPGLYHMDPREIRFSQPNAGPYFNNGSRVDALIPKLKSGEISPYDLPPIQVVQKDGKLFSIDHRRLLAFNSAGVDKIPVHIVSLDDPAIYLKFRNRFNPILDEGQYAVVVPKSGRVDALSLLEEYGMINRGRYYEP